MAAVEFFPLFDPWELVIICQLNKASYHLMKTVVNFEVLFKAQGIILAPAEVEETKIAVSKALQVAAKCYIRKYTTKSKQIIPNSYVKDVYTTSSIPNMPMYAVKSLERLRNLTITRVCWN